MISGTEFYFGLDSSEYELKLTATNGPYDSKTLGPIKFWVNAENQGASGVTLLTPPQNSYWGQAGPDSYTWSSVSGATYEFSLRSGQQFPTGEVIISQSNISAPSFTTSGTYGEGAYTWGVKTYIGATESLYTTGTFYVDTVAPNQATLSLPTNGKHVYSYW